MSRKTSDGGTQLSEVDWKGSPKVGNDDQKVKRGGGWSRQRRDWKIAGVMVDRA